MEPPKSFSTAIFCILATVIALARPEAESELKPHFLYMKRLREHLSDSHLTIPDSTDRSASVEGKLVATSIETQSTGGIGKIISIVITSDIFLVSCCGYLTFTGIVSVELLLHDMRICSY